MNSLLLDRPVDSWNARNCWNALFALFALFLAAAATHAQGSSETGVPTPQVERASVVVEGVRSGDVVVFRKSVIVRGSVQQGVISIGGDVIVEGRVEGDVAAIGGVVVQRKGAYIGGDVMVLGGLYQPEPGAEKRNPQSATIMYTGFEQELHELMYDPTSFLTPRLSAGYLGGRLLAVLFWFIVSLSLTAVSPGAVSRAAARLQLTSLRVALIGLVSTLVLGFGIPLALKYLPSIIAVLLGITAVLLLVISYLFGRVIIHAATGRWLERRLLPEGKRSETVALLIGAAFWTLMLSLPYVWPAVITGLLVTSLGLALTVRYRIGWRPAKKAA
ncbi:MAG TPA: polymer-forming cytoskeletal protein [Pyrinomonadaceae bacterium]